jgi:hypothetical protein
MRRRLFLAASLILLCGCATMDGPQVTPAQAPLAELESLYSVDAGRAALTVRVGSNGCTKKEDFAFYVERKGDDVTLALARKRLDPCRSFVMGRAELTFSYAELGLDSRTRIFVLNPVVAWTGPGS